MPPDNWCGYSAKATFGFGIPTDLSSAERRFGSLAFVHVEVEAQ